MEIKMPEAIAAAVKERGSVAVLVIMLALGGYMEFSGPQADKTAKLSERIAVIEQRAERNTDDVQAIAADVDDTSRNVYDVSISQAEIKAVIKAMSANIERVLERVENHDAKH